MQSNINTFYILIKAAIIGASGYTGIELLKLLVSRDDIELQYLAADTNAGKSVSDVYPQFSEETDLRFEKYDPSALSSVDVVFLSLPHGESMKIVPVIIRSGIKIIDLGGDFRLNDPADYSEYYKFRHLSPELLERSVYGLTEINRSEIAGTDLVANPGCFATGILLALIPAINNNMISGSNIVINSLSGVSGAGKKSAKEYSFAELNENVQAYKISVHQHIPEIRQALSKDTGQPVSFTFIPQLGPFNRGIYATIVCDVNPTVSEQDILSAYTDFYADSPFVRIRKTIPKLHDVVNSNFCDIYFQLETQTGKLIIISVLDNLLKGAAGQAIQNFNLMFGLPEHQGLSIGMKSYV